ncbi:MAG: hypothetical protein GWP91_06055, partial [Rhodobacterales bacterium]|nr:hypothetical protein [Rhodobacterales bacterium]
MNFAIVGMDCILPGANDAEAWISAQTPAIRKVPPGRWPMPPVSVLGKRGEADRTLGVHGAFVEDFAFKAGDLNLNDWPISKMDPLFGWTLHVVRGALQGVSADPQRTALVMANLGLPTSGAVRAISKPIVDALGVHLPWLDGGVPEDRWHSGLPAQIAAQVFDFADSVAVDAACASGLYAVYLAMARLERGEVDLAIAAAANRSDSSYLHLGFSQLRALSASGNARPLDQRADGLIIGEGAAAVALKRLPDAIAAGDTIHAVLRGGGLTADGRKGNMLAPDASGQLRALQAAWDHAGLSPTTLGYVECHATGTQLGDGVELQALHDLLEGAGATQPVAVASAKALIGHTVTVAGLAGLIRAVGAVRDGFLPGAYGAEQPHTAVQASRHLNLELQRRPWVGAGIRRAGVSAFGFGGTNAHLIVEAFEGPLDAPPTLTAAAQPMAIVGLGMQLGDLRGTQALAALKVGLPRKAAPAAARGEVVALPEGTWLSEVCVDPRRFKIPPLELAELLPQQLLMLDVAADALAQAPQFTPARTASVVGMGVDHHIAEQVVRWAAIDAGVEAPFCPPLNASRVQGHLPNFVANRIAAQFDLQGPSWTTSSGQLSGLHALDQASILLATHVADTVLVGAVDLPGHAGSTLAAAKVLGPQPITEGAIALVVMRLDEAKAAGCSILGVIHEVHFDRADAKPSPWGRAEALDGLLSVVHGLATDATAITAHAQPDARAKVHLQSRV